MDIIVIFLLGIVICVALLIITRPKNKKEFSTDYKKTLQKRAEELENYKKDHKNP